MTPITEARTGRLVIYPMNQSSLNFFRAFLWVGALQAEPHHFQPGIHHLQCEAQARSTTLFLGRKGTDHLMEQTTTLIHQDWFDRCLRCSPRGGC